MSFKRKLISTVGLALAVGTFSTFVAAQDNSTTTTQTAPSKKERKFDGMRGEGKRMRGGKHGDRMMMGALHRLNLTDAQKAQIKTIFETNKPNQAQFDSVRGLMDKKRSGTALTADEQATLDSFRAQRQANAKQTHDAILAVLTDEQRTQLEQLKQQKGERRGFGRRPMKTDGQTTTPTDNN